MSRLPVFAFALLPLLFGACTHRDLAPEASSTPASSDGGVAPHSGQNTASTPGSRDQDASVSQILRDRLGGIVTCYEALLKDNPKLQGSVLITLDVAPGGELLDLSIASEDLVEGSGVQTCLRRGLEGLHLPATEEGTLIEVPFRFAPRVVEPEEEPTTDPEAPAPE